MGRMPGVVAVSAAPALAGRTLRWRAARCAAVRLPSLGGLLSTVDCVVEWAAGPCKSGSLQQTQRGAMLSGRKALVTGASKGVGELWRAPWLSLVVRQLPPPRAPLRGRLPSGASPGPLSPS